MRCRARCWAETFGFHSQTRVAMLYFVSVGFGCTRSAHWAVQRLLMLLGFIMPLPLLQSKTWRGIAAILLILAVLSALGHSKRSVFTFNFNFNFNYCTFKLFLFYKNYRFCIVKNWFIKCSGSRIWYFNVVLFSLIVWIYMEGRWVGCYLTLKVLFFFLVN